MHTCKFFENNKNTIIEKITSSDLLMELFDMDSFLAAIKGFVLERDILLHMYSVAVFVEVYPCKLAVEDRGLGISPRADPKSLPRQDDHSIPNSPDISSCRSTNS